MTLKGTRDRMRTRNPHGIAPGQRLYFLPSNKDTTARWVTVATVGRSWVTLVEGNRWRLDIDTLHSEDWPRGRCYTSKEEADLFLERGRAWCELRSIVGGLYYPPDDVSLDRLKSSIRMLTPDNSDCDEGIQ